MGSHNQRPEDERKQDVPMQNPCARSRGSLSVPKECETPGASNFQGPLFHSAKWDHSFDWKNKDVVALGIIILPAIRDIVAKLPLRKWMFCNTIRAYNERRPECC